MSALEARLESVAGALERLTLPGGRVLPMALPRDESACVELTRLASRDGLALLPLGHGTKLAWCPPPERVDFALSTRSLCGVLRYEPGDGTLSARAGTPIGELSRTVRAGGHHLSPELPSPPGAAAPTLGGAVAAAESGLDRLRHGPLRNNLLGTRVLLSDGTRSKSGGQLVKNVTGYDLHRLYCGSHGSLCLILEAALRLFPLPETELCLRLPCSSRDAALQRAAALRDSGARPLALLVHQLAPLLEEAPGEAFAAGRSEAPFELLALFAGGPEALAYEQSLAAAALPGASLHSEEQARRLRTLARDLERAPGGWPELLLSCLPSELPAELARLEQARAKSGLAARVLAHPLLGRACAWLWDAACQGPATPDAQSLGCMDDAMRSGRARVRWRSAAEARAAGLAPAEPASPGLPLMRRLQDALDPAAVFARGRGHGGL